jgi:BirA family biotin operon repressor/biotin-[acetyl-CoA-carboxylase] ligase
LVKNRNTYISGQELAERAGVSRTVIWNVVKELQSEGIQISSSTKKGYKLENLGNKFSETLIKEKISNYWHKIVVADIVESTNNEARNLLENGKEHGTVAIIAEEQTAGRGRMGREFVSPKGGLYMSVAFRPNIDVSLLQLITACTAVAVCEAIDGVTGLSTQIKWVNDIFINGKKLCGILTESLFSMENTELNLVVVGLGINLETAPVEGSIALSEIAKFDKNVLCGALLNSLEKNYKNISSKSFIQEYQRRSCIIGKDLTVVKYNSSHPAKVLAIDDDAALIVQYPDGLMEILTSGEVSLLPPSQITSDVFRKS